MADELKPVGTLLTLDAIWRRISTAHRHTTTADRRSASWCWSTKRGCCCAKGSGRSSCSGWPRSARKYGAGLTVVTQDAADVLATDVGRAVVSNAATQILLRQAPQAIDAVTQAFHLTDGERAFLLSAPRGDALLAAGSSRVAFHAMASDVEHDLVVTGPQFAHDQ